MFSDSYISDACIQKQIILSWRIIFNALTTYRWYNVPFISGDKAPIRNLYWCKNIQFLENTGKIFEDKLQQGKNDNAINRDLKNMQHWPKAWNQQTEAYTYWKERDIGLLWMRW